MSSRPTTHAKSSEFVFKHVKQVIKLYMFILTS